MKGEKREGQRKGKGEERKGKRGGGERKGGRGKGEEGNNHHQVRSLDMIKLEMRDGNECGE